METITFKEDYESIKLITNYGEYVIVQEPDGLKIVEISNNSVISIMPRTANSITIKKI